MVGDSQTVVQAIQNRKPGEVVIYGNNDEGGHWVTVTGSCTNNLRHREPFPWEHRLARLEALVAATTKLFGRFNTGWIPSKGHPGLIVDPYPDHIVPQPSPLDLRRLIQQLYTPRRLCAP